jgi:hypothetical protein
MGPPDGWCYEGKHTVCHSPYRSVLLLIDMKTDMKRARFRADSTLHDDKLVPCSRLRCHRQSPSSITSSDSVDEKPRSRKRARKTVEHQDSSEASARASSSIKGEESDGEEKKFAKKPGVKEAMKKRSRPRKSAGVDNMDVDDGDEDTCEKPVSTGSTRAKASVKKVKTVKPKSTVGKGSPPARIVAKQPLEPSSPRLKAGVVCNLGSESAEESDVMDAVKTKKRRKVA